MEKDAVVEWGRGKAVVPAGIPGWVRARGEARASDEWAALMLLEPVALVSAQSVDKGNPMSGDCHVQTGSAPNAGP